MVFLPPILKRTPANVNNLKCGRTKTTGLIRNVITPAGEEALVKTLQKEHFSITIDEATDRTTTKFLTIIVKYYCKERGKPVDEFFSIQVVTNTTAEGLKDLVLEEFRKAEIPLNNIIGFASENCATMAGHIGGVASCSLKACHTFIGSDGLYLSLVCPLFCRSLQQARPQYC
jgi:hypothetical protein